jgi:hypothetical protein
MVRRAAARILRAKAAPQAAAIDPGRLYEPGTGFVHSITM